MLDIISTSSIGLGLFILGTKSLRESLNYIASNKLKYFLSNLKIHPVLGVLVGCLITLVLQSSSTTTIIIVSLVESNFLTLYQAIPIIMGTNIGSTVTSQLIAFNVGAYGFIPFFIAILISIFSKNKKIQYVGKVLIGFSLIFIGIDFLSKGLSPLSNYPALRRILIELGHSPILGILMGFLLTGIIQSSSTSVAIIQSLTANSLMSLNSAIPILLGTNIGTCTTILLTSLYLNKTAKKAALFHLSFNFIGVLLIFPFINILSQLSVMLSPLNLSRQVANAHTIFNIFTTILFLPFTKKLINFFDFK